MPDFVESQSFTSAARTRLFSPYAALEEHASRQSDAPAIVLDAQTITFGDCLERVTAFAGWLLQNGLVPGEVTGICLRGELVHIYAATSVLCLGTPQISLGVHENGVTKRALADKVGVTAAHCGRSRRMDGGPTSHCHAAAC